MMYSRRPYPNVLHHNRLVYRADDVLRVASRTFDGLSSFPQGHSPERFWVLYCRDARHVFLLRRGETEAPPRFAVTKSMWPSPSRSPRTTAEGARPTPNSAGARNVPSPAFRKIETLL